MATDRSTLPRRQGRPCQHHHPAAARPRAIRVRWSPARLGFGLLAVAGLTVLTVGVPYALVTVFGMPVPHGTPKLSILNHQLDVTTILKGLCVLVWLAWLQLVWCVIAEVRAVVRHAPRPAKVPLAGGTQAMVHRLVATALLLFAATTALSPALMHQVAGAVPISAGRETGPAAGFPGGRGGTFPPQLASPPRLANPPGAAPSPPATRPPKVNRSPEHAARTGKIYVVQPPHGRFHESLWEIAQRFLGDGQRYREIFALNAGRIQPDGSKLTVASLIRPGWVLHMPRDAHGPGIVTAAPAGRHSAAQDRVDHNQAAGPGVRLARARGKHAAPRGASQSHPTDSGTAAKHREANPGSPSELAAASLLTAGALTALGRHRREQLWQRAFGRRVVMPGAKGAPAEPAMRSSADDPPAQLLDSGLRYLSYALALTGRTPPTVFAAHLSPETLDLWIAPADLGPPAPWTPVGDGQVWRLPFAALTQEDVAESSDALALLPGLVSIGTDDAGRVLVDLEAADGLIAVTGPQQLVTGVLSSMAAELVTNRWSDEVRLTLVGFGDDLAGLAPDRVTAVRTLDEAMPALEARVPHCLITAAPPTAAQRSRLLALAGFRQAAVVAGDVPGASWTWEVTPGGRLLTGVLDLDVEAQLLSGWQQRGVRS